MSTEVLGMDPIHNCTCTPMSMPAMMMMQMTFFASDTVTILFKGWKVTNAWQMVLSCIAMFVLAFLYEVLKTYRERFAESVRQRSFQTIQDNVSGQQVRSHMVSQVDAVLQTLLQALSFTLAYVLMLVVMTYNIYIFLAVILGDAVGYYLTLNLRPTVSSTDADHCH